MPAALYLVPVPLGDGADPQAHLPPATVSVICRLDCFVAENAKSARAVLRRLPMGRPLQALEIRELNQHTPPALLPELLGPLRAGRPLGLMSEAGCPAVADPGAALVQLAHREQLPVMPLIGPSALLLALMVSGMNGQSFAFTGYLPVDPAARRAAIQELLARSRRFGQTQLMIETPYRNQALLDALLEALPDDAHLAVAASLSLPEQWVRSAPAAQWRAHAATLPRAPAVFLLQAAASAAGPLSATAAARKKRR
ncbi:MAG: SAM-dependent methyltransferase [Betaproteobacteria bacterium]|nr:SAM-dependent methyltransferase [Betaproteobacteria bacterium]